MAKKIFLLSFLLLVLFFPMSTLAGSCQCTVSSGVFGPKSTGQCQTGIANGQECTKQNKVETVLGGPARTTTCQYFNDENCGVASITPTEEKMPPLVKPNLEIDIPNLKFSDIILKKTDTGSYIYIPYLAEYLAAVYKFLVAISGILAGLMITYAGVKWMLAAGSPDKITDAKKKIGDAIIGLILVVGSYTIFYLVNPDLVSFKALRIESVKREEFSFTENTDKDLSPGEDQIVVPDVGNNGVPLFKQWKFKDSQYGDCGTIKTSGCGPTSLAMVMKFYGASVDPSTVGKTIVAANQSYRGCPIDIKNEPGCTSQCKGTAYAAFVDPKVIGSLKGQFLGTNEQKIRDALNAGKPVIVSVGQSIFTKNGHFIVLTGIEQGTGKILINDPNKNITNASPAQVFPVIKQAFLIEK